MRTIENFEQFIHYLNKVGLRFHGQGYIPVTQKMWCNLEKAILISVSYPFKIRFHRNDEQLEIRKDKKTVFIDRVYDFS